AADPTVALPGWVALLAAGTLILLGTRAAAGRRTVLASALLVAVAAAWLTTSTSAGFWDRTAPVLGKLQFPWRWLTLLTPAVALLAALLVDAMTFRLGRWQRRTATGLVGLLLLANMAGGLSWQPLPTAAAAVTSESMLAFDAQMGQVGASWTGEFLPRWVTEQRWAIGREPSEQQDVPQTPIAMQALAQSMGYLEARYAVTLPEPAQIVFDRFYFPAWQVTVDGAAQAARPQGSLGLLAVDLPAGSHEVAVAWKATPAVRAGWLLAAVGWLAVLGLLLLARTHRPHLALAGLLLWASAGMVAGMAIAAGSGYAWEVQPVRADYGPVQLTGISAPPARPGTTTAIALHWLVLAPGDAAIAFVHLLDAQGQIVAQYDGPMTGPYRPAARWQPGMVMTTPMPVALPQALAPGRYALRIGLYRPGEADQPLTPAGSAVPFVTGGWLEVRP
ncbi:MAG: hypothetical protein H3C34_21675, partial [Caldilineaceae bacterium]|nr:hypothetical protein [Caldilineaceae bacterium]